MKKFLDQLKQYWFLIVFIFAGVAAVSSLVVSTYVADIAMSTLKGDAAKLYVQELVAAEFEEKGAPDGEAIAGVNGKLELHGSKIEGLEGGLELTQNQLQDVARILMQPPDGG